MKALKKTITILALAALLVGILPAGVFAADKVSLTVTNNLYVVQGASSYVDIEAAAPDDVSYKLVLTAPEGSEIRITNGSSGVLKGNAKATLQYSVASNADSGYRTLTLRAVNPNDESDVYAKYNVYVNVVRNIDGFSSLSKIVFDVNYSVTGSDSLLGGQINNLKLSIFNRATVRISNARVKIDLPSGLSIQTGSDVRNIGSFTYGETYIVDYPITLSENIESGSYPISVTVSGTTVENNTAIELTSTETVYIPVSGKGAAPAGDSSVPLLIVDNFKAAEIKAGEEFTLDLGLKNVGTKEIKGVKVSISDPSGKLYPAKTNNIYISSVAAGELSKQSIAMKAGKDAAGANVSLNVYMNYRDASGNVLENSDAITISVPGGAQVVDGSVVNPILMVTDYNYGGENVLAGSDFQLTITVTNTSGKPLRNIKLTVADGSGTVIPEKGSSSAFISSIGAGGSATKTFYMTVANSAMAGINNMSVSMTYEDNDGGSFSASDSISVPIAQKDRLVVDDILDPGYLSVGMEGYINVNYYNMGQTVLHNLRISVEGENFTMQGNSSTYVGNMASGRSDYYNFVIYPGEEGTSSGTITFSYEDGAGNEQSVVKEFSFNIGPSYFPEEPWDDVPVEPQPAGGLPSWWKWVAIGAGVVVIIVAYKVVKKRKKAKADALDLDE